MSLADIAGLAAPYALASSSETYVTAGSATTTNFIVGIDPADEADLNLYVFASSTSSVVQFQVDYSDDTLCTVPRGGSSLLTASSCNWYREDVNSTSGSVVTEAALPFRQWTPGTLAASTHAFRLGVNSLVSHRYVRIGLAAGAANYAVWAQVGRKVQIQ